MSFKGISAVTVFLGLMLLANSSSFAPSSFDWTAGAPVAGGSVEVKVTSAPCHGCTVVLTVGGITTTARLAEAPGCVSLAVPPGSEGLPYTIFVLCATERDSQQGIVL